MPLKYNKCSRRNGRAFWVPLVVFTANTDTCPPVRNPLCSLFKKVPSNKLIENWLSSRTAQNLFCLVWPSISTKIFSIAILSCFVFVFVFSIFSFLKNNWMLFAYCWWLYLEMSSGIINSYSFKRWVHINVILNNNKAYAIAIMSPDKNVRLAVKTAGQGRLLYS
jgi:hypothetical protein